MDLNEISDIEVSQFDIERIAHPDAKKFFKELPRATSTVCIATYNCSVSFLEKILSLTSSWVHVKLLMNKNMLYDKLVEFLKTHKKIETRVHDRTHMKMYIAGGYVLMGSGNATLSAFYEPKETFQLIDFKKDRKSYRAKKQEFEAMWKEAIPFEIAISESEKAESFKAAHTELMRLCLLIETRFRELLGRNAFFVADMDVSTSMYRFLSLIVPTLYNVLKSSEKLLDIDCAYVYSLVEELYDEIQRALSHFTRIIIYPLIFAKRLQKINSILLRIMPVIARNMKEEELGIFYKELLEEARKLYSILKSKPFFNDVYAGIVNLAKTLNIGTVKTIDEINVGLSPDEISEIELDDETRGDIEEIIRSQKNMFNVLSDFR